MSGFASTMLNYVLPTLMTVKLHVLYFLHTFVQIFPWCCGHQSLVIGECPAMHLAVGSNNKQIQTTLCNHMSVFQWITAAPALEKHTDSCRSVNF